MNSKRQARRKVKKNPLKNIGLLSRLNPYATVQKRQTLLTQLKGRRTGTTPESKVKISFFFNQSNHFCFKFISDCRS
jgi:hypothetical protein